MANCCHHRCVCCCSAGAVAEPPERRSRVASPSVLDAAHLTASVFPSTRHCQLAASPLPSSPSSIDAVIRRPSWLTCCSAQPAAAGFRSRAL